MITCGTLKFCIRKSVVQNKYRYVVISIILALQVDAISTAFYDTDNWISILFKYRPSLAGGYERLTTTPFKNKSRLYQF